MKRALCTIFFLSLGLASATRYPLTLTDDLGRTVTLSGEPKRVISMLPSSTETLCALEACGKLVGVDEYSDFPAQVRALPKVGNLYAPNIEAMVALKPDLVLVSKYGKLTEPLERAGVTVLAINPEQYDEIFSKTTLLGKVVNREAQARTLNLKVQSEIKLTELRTRALRKPSVYFEIDPTPYTVGPNSFMGVLLGKAGGINVIPAALGDFPKISPELILEKNPAIMLGLTLEAARTRPGWDKISAVRTGRVLELPAELNDMISRPGPRVGQGLAGLAKLLHPQLK